jgi:hypothetical protein
MVITVIVVQLCVVAMLYGHVQDMLDARSVQHLRATMWLLRGPLLLLLGVALWFAYILHTHSLSRVGIRYYTGGSSYGDLPFHLNIINSFLYGVNRHANIIDGFRAVFFADAKLVYPFLPDWHTAVIVGAGWCVRASPSLHVESAPIATTTRKL